MYWSIQYLDKKTGKEAFPIFHSRESALYGA